MRYLLRFLKWMAYVLGGFIMLILIYLGCEYVLSRSTVKEVPTADTKDILIYIQSNGVHTDLVVPVHHPLMNWETVFPFENTIRQQTDFSYIGIGWGDKGFYLNTPEWSDLKVSTALVAATGLGETAIHATYYRAVHEDQETKPIKISETQYQKLIAFVQAALEVDNEGKSIYIKTNAQYGNNDAFYEAKGAYTVFHTCNTWTNNALKAAGLRASRWTAFDKGILYQYQDEHQN